MSRKDYKQGAADAMNAYEAFARKQEEATHHVGDQIGRLSGDVAELGKSVEFISDYITDKEKQALYQANMPVDIAKLDEADQYLLVAVLYELAQQELPTEEQQNYIRAVQKYLKIRDVQRNIDLAVVENIPDTATIIAVMQAVMEYFYLGTHPGTYTEDEMDFLDSFMANRKTRKEIMARIKAIVNAVGKQGLAEKYGFVPEDDNDSDEVVSNYYPLSAQIADMVSVKIGRYHKVTARFSGQRIDTDNFVIYARNSQILSIDKRTSAQTICLPNENWSITTAWYHDSILLDKADGNVCILDLASNKRTDLYLSGYYRNGIWMADNYIVYKNRSNEMQCLDVQNGSTWIIYGVRDSIFNARDILMLDGKMYFLEDDGIMIGGLLLVEYDFCNRTIKALQNYENACLGQLSYNNNRIHVVTNEHIPLSVTKQMLKIYACRFGENSFESKEIATLEARSLSSYHFSRCGKLIYVDPNYNLCIWNIENGEKLVHQISEHSEPSIFLLGSFVYFEKEENVYRVSLASNEQSMV